MTDNRDPERNYRALAFAAIALLALVVAGFSVAKFAGIADRGLDLVERYVTLAEEDAKAIRQHTTTTWEQNGRRLEVDQDRGPTESIREWHEAHAKSVGIKRDVERDLDLAEATTPKDPGK